MSITVNNEEYLTAGESCKYLGVSGKTFTEFQRDYNLKWMTRPGLGNRKFFKKKDLDPILEFREGRSPEDRENGHKRS